MNRSMRFLLVFLSLVLLLSVVRPVWGDETVGCVQQIRVHQMTVCEKSGDQYLFHLGERVVIYINDEAKSLQDLRRGDVVLVVWNNIEGTMVAREVHCRRN